MDRKRYPSANELRKSEREFWLRLSSLDEQIQSYEDDVLQSLARSLIPIDRLESEAKKQCGTETMDDKTRDFLLRELLRWFKYEFFSWTDKPKCERCQGATAYSAHLEPTPDERRYGANRVEGYRCETCSGETRFPRYNDPGKLLETRTGRCGEWANCFTLCCRAMNFEARYVLDWTDHVWTEVYSQHQRCWLHCDPCENASDTPLMYEEGWGKKLTYVIAFSKDEIVDVTWRYSRKHGQIWQRRVLCRESVLIKFIDQLNVTRRERLSPERRRQLEDRALVECVELIWPRLEVKDGENEGRSSGDLQWRRERGELGDGKSKTTEGEKEEFIFRLDPKELEEHWFVLEYYSASDEYRRTHASESNRVTRDWRSCVFQVNDVLRKVELDWKMVYLARKEKAQTGNLVWKFDFSNDNLEIEELAIKVDRETFQSGIVRILLCQLDSCSVIDGTGEYKINNLESDSFEIKAMLSGGNGDCAWQHAQLFRASLDANPPMPSMVVRVKLRPKRRSQ